MAKGHAEHSLLNAGELLEMSQILLQMHPMLLERIFATVVAVVSGICCLDCPNCRAKCERSYELMGCVKRLVVDHTSEETQQTVRELQIYSK